jgi:hypothetical protein
MSGKRVARHAQTKNRRRWLIGAAVGVAVVIVAGIVALGWLPGTGSGDAGDQTASAPSSSATPSTDTSTAGTERSPSSAPKKDTDVQSAKQLRACENRVQMTERAVKAAASGVGTWNSHVQARTDMLEGRISVEKMDAIWASTKAAGPGGLEKFDKALRADPEPSKCAGLKGASGAERTVVARCVQRSRAATVALDSAEAAMKDWGAHLANMKMYADDEMSAAMAQGEWVKAWRNAPKNINAYRDATAALAKAPTCPSPTS